jgi:GTPase
MLSTLAIVGRPNVGKSTLFNRLTRTRNAIVGDMPGLTRDRQYGVAKVGEETFIVVDTGGIGETTNEIEELMSQQAELAMQEAEAILFLVDARSGLTAGDENIAKKLRKLNKPIYLAANKTDGLDPKMAIVDFYKLGIGEPHAVSAEHGRGIEDLVADILKKLPKPEKFEREDQRSATKIAFVGRPNVGKSTLVNRILGEERVVVYDAPGTTRDSIFINFKRQNKDYVLIDTAGIRRRGKVYESFEKFSVIKAMQAIEAANVVVFLVDAQENITDQDLRLLGFVLDAGRALVIAVNKWDNLTIRQRDKIKSEMDRRLTFIDFAAIYYISALHGTGVGNLFTAIDKAYASATRELKTNEVTEILQKACEAYQPPMVGGRQVKFRMAHVGGHNPPSIIIHGQRVDSLPDHYKKYLEKYFRKALRLFGTPIRIEFVSAKRRER